MNQPTLEWITQKSTFNTAGFDDVPDVNVSFTDAQGNCYVVYKTFGGSLDGNNFGQIIVFKTDKDGNLLWARQSPLSSPGDLFATAQCFNPCIAVDNNGNVFVAYQFVSQGSFPLPSPNNEIGSTDIVVFKFDTNGNFQWVNQNVNVSGSINNGVFNTTSFNVNPSIALDPNGNPVVAYSTGGNFPGLTTKTGSQDIVLFKLDGNDSKLLWIVQNNTFNAGSSANNNDPSVSIDNNGLISVSYQTNGTAPGMGNSKTSDPGNNDVVVFQLSSDGSLTNWCKQNSSFNGSGNGNNFKTQISVNNNHIFTTYESTNVLSGQSQTGVSDIVVFQLSSSDGSTNWALQNNTFNAGGGAQNQSPKIDIDISENVYVSYQTTGLAPLTPAGYIPNNSQTGDRDIVVFRLTGQVVEWCLQNSQFNANPPPSPMENLEPSISVLGDGTGIYVTYYTNGKAINDIPPGNINENTGSYDIVVFKFSQPSPPPPPPNGSKKVRGRGKIYLIPEQNLCHDKFKFIVPSSYYNYLLTNINYFRLSNE
jgi:hypothetical protein